MTPRERALLRQRIDEETRRKLLRHGDARFVDLEARLALARWRGFKLRKELEREEEEWKATRVKPKRRRRAHQQMSRAAA